MIDPTTLSSLLGTGDARAAWTGVLWDGDGRRLLPRCAQIDALLQQGPRLLSACSTFPAAYFLPTIEFVDSLAAFARARGAKRVLEVGAGDGFLTAALRERAPDVEWLAADDGSWLPPGAGGVRVRAEYVTVPTWVDRRGADDAVAHTCPDLAVWAWAPAGAAWARGTPLLDVSDRTCGGFPDARGTRSAVLSAFARGRTDRLRGDALEHRTSCHLLEAAP